MKNFKLILKSLISNNACIDGGRKKPWYFAVIILVLSMFMAILPLFVQTWNTNGDDVFASNAYGADNTLVALSKDIETKGYNLHVVEDVNKEKVFRMESATEGIINSYEFKHTISNPDNQSEPLVDYKVFWRATKEISEDFYNEAKGDGTFSFIIFTENHFYIHVMNISSKATIKDVNCLKAANDFEVGYSVNSLLVKEGTVTDQISKTFANWKAFIRKSYNATRLTGVWQTCLIMGGINLGIVLFMGLMIWILTRGKNNPYRIFNLWETQKTAWWACITPAILALALGFLIKSFANILFPMLIGIRVMWLSMKSLRPDGSGYAGE